MIRLENITKIYNEKVDDTKALDEDRGRRVCICNGSVGKW